MQQQPSSPFCLLILLEKFRYFFNPSTNSSFSNDVKEDNGIVHINFSKSFTRYLQRKLVMDEIELAGKYFYILISYRSPRGHTEIYCVQPMLVELSFYSWDAAL